MINYIRILYTLCRHHKHLKWSSPFELVFMPILSIVIGVGVTALIDIVILTPIYINHSLSALTIYLTTQIAIIITEIISETMNKEIYTGLLDELSSH